MVYLVYITIRNIPKEIWWKLLQCAQMLISYIPTTKLKGIQNKATHSCMLVNLFHSCMWVVLGPIALHGGTGLEMISGNGIWHQCHPILSNFIGNYPKQYLVTSTYYGECPKCQIPCAEPRDYKQFLSCNYSEALRSFFFFLEFGGYRQQLVLQVIIVHVWGNYGATLLFANPKVYITEQPPWGLGASGV